MATRPSSLTIFDRATPQQRAHWRQIALKVPCPSCGSAVGLKCASMSGTICKPHSGRIVAAKEQIAVEFVGGGKKKPEPKTPAEEALDDIAKLCGVPEWEYPGQVVRDVRMMRERLEGVTDDKAERLALDMDHRCKDHSEWWKALERARRFLKGGTK